MHVIKIDKRVCVRGAIMLVRNRNAYLRSCPRCEAEAREPCVYTSVVFRRDLNTGEYYFTSIGDPMLLVHKERR